MDAVATPMEEPEERMEGDDYEYEADEEEPKNKFPDLCSKINCDEFAKVNLCVGGCNLTFYCVGKYEITLSFT